MSANILGHHVHAGTYADSAEADLIIVSAGASMQPDTDNPGSDPTSTGTANTIKTCFRIVKRNLSFAKIVIKNYNYNNSLQKGYA